MAQSEKLGGSARRLRVGDRIEKDFGSSPVRGTVIEDRGNFGVGGEQIVRVSLKLTHVDEPLEGELPAASLRLVTEPACD